MTKRGNIPSNSEAYARSVGTKPPVNSSIPNKDQLESRNPVENYFDQTNPIDPVSSSHNWATEEPRRGFNMDDLNTYIIRDTDRLQAGIFDRFVLKEDTAQFPARIDQDITLGKMIHDRLGPPRKSFADIKKYARSTLSGKSYSNVKRMHEDQSDARSRMTQQ
jgi:hypothetical protein